MAEIRLTSWGKGSLSQYLQGFIHPRWLFGISEPSTVLPTAWRIIPGLGYVVNNHGDRKSPRPGVVGPLPNGLISFYMGVTSLTSTGSPSSKWTGSNNWVFPKIMAPPNHPFVHRVFHYKTSILGGNISLFLQTSNSWPFFLEGKRILKTTPNFFDCPSPAPPESRLRRDVTPAMPRRQISRGSRSKNPPQLHETAP